MMHGRFKRLTRALVLAYAAALVLYFALCGVAFARSRAWQAGGALTRRELPLAALTQNSILPRDGAGGGERFVSTDGDPQLVYTQDGAPFYAGRVTFAATPHKPAGEIALYYTTAEGQKYTEKQKIWAKQAPDGSWYFDLPQRRLYSLRIDPGTVGGVIWQVQRVVLNDVRPPASFFVPDALTLLLLLCAPGFLVALTAEAGRIVRQGKKPAVPPTGGMAETLRDVVEPTSSE